jgi:hypothetical protein
MGKGNNESQLPPCFYLMEHTSFMLITRGNFTDGASHQLPTLLEQGTCTDTTRNTKDCI